jgi:hypothetical protein
MPLRASDHYNNIKVGPWLVVGARELTQTKETKNKGCLAYRAARSVADKAHGKDRKLVGELLKKWAAEERSRR